MGQAQPDTKIILIFLLGCADGEIGVGNRPNAVRHNCRRPPPGAHSEPGQETHPGRKPGGNIWTGFCGWNCYRGSGGGDSGHFCIGSWVLALTDRVTRAGGVALGSGSSIRAGYPRPAQPGGGSELVSGGFDFGYSEQSGLLHVMMGYLISKGIVFTLISYVFAFRFARGVFSWLFPGVENFCGRFSQGKHFSFYKIFLKNPYNMAFLRPKTSIKTCTNSLQLVQISVSTGIFNQLNRITSVLIRS